MCEIEMSAPADLDDWPNIGTVMSNFDNRVEPTAEADLRAGKVTGDYSAWGFHAVVWADGNKFRARVKRYHAVMGCYSAPTLRDLMRDLSERYGWR